MKNVMISQNLTDKAKIEKAIAEAKATTHTEGITKVGIKFKKLLHILILL